MRSALRTGTGSFPSFSNSAICELFFFYLPLMYLQNSSDESQLPAAAACLVVSKPSPSTWNRTRTSAPLECSLTATVSEGMGVPTYYSLKCTFLPTCQMGQVQEHKYSSMHYSYIVSRIRIILGIEYSELFYLSTTHSRAKFVIWHNSLSYQWLSIGLSLSLLRMRKRNSTDLALLHLYIKTSLVFYCHLARCDISGFP